MITVIICACIVGGMWWYNLNQIKRLEKKLEITEASLRKDLADNLSDQWKAEENINDRIMLLAKDIMELQKKAKKKK